MCVVIKVAASDAEILHAEENSSSSDRMEYGVE